MLKPFPAASGEIYDKIKIFIVLFYRRINNDRTPLTVSLAEIRSSGEVNEKTVSLDDFLLSIPKKLPLRDVRLLLRPTKSNIARQELII